VISMQANYEMIFGLVDIGDALVIDSCVPY
jgi:hypothetical protein